MKSHFLAREGLEGKLKQHILEGGKDFNTIDDVGQRPIHYSCLFGHLNCETAVSLSHMVMFRQRETDFFNFYKRPQGSIG